MSDARWEPRRGRDRRAERGRRLRLWTSLAATAPGVVLAAAILAGCASRVHRVRETQRCANGVVSACTRDICATYAPAELPAGCLDWDAADTETSDAWSTDTPSAPDTGGEDAAGPDMAADTLTDTDTDTTSDAAACDPSTEGCPCSYLGKPDGVCGGATVGADGACAQPEGYAANEASCDGLDNDCDGVMDEGCAQGEFVKAPAGTFTMGSPTSELGRDDDEVQHEVTLTRSYYLQETEVTQIQWEARMGNKPSQSAGCGEGCPVENVSWWEALAYANAVSADQGLPPCYTMEGCTGTAGGGQADGMSCTGAAVNAPDGDPYLCTGYRLPTEAEWEYAYRAGTTTAFYDGDTSGDGNQSNMDVIGWYQDNAGGQPHPAAQKAANEWGLYDMAGNVEEWTWDRSASYPKGAVTDPTGDEANSFRVVRGGSWIDTAAHARAAHRAEWDPDHRGGDLGFRLARTAP